MKPSTLLACLVFVFSCVSDTLAQFTPVVAKIKITSYQMQSDATEKAVVSQGGFYYRSSAGDEMTTHFYVTENGKKREAGRSTYIDSSTGKTYVLTHNAREARVVQQRDLPLIPNNSPPNPDRIVGRDVIDGLKCIIVPMESNDGSTPPGKVWLSKDTNIAVKMEFKLRGKRLVREFYDIEFTEPDPSKFGIPSNYSIDDSECQGCSQTSLP